MGKKVEAKNGLESYAYNLRNTLNDEKFKDKIDSGDKDTLETKIKEITSWVDANDNADIEEFEEKKEELEAISNPIMMKLYGSGQGGMPPGAGGMPGGMPGGGMPGGPKVEEVD